MSVEVYAIRYTHALLTIEKGNKMKILADLTRCHQNKTHYYLNEATKQTVSAALLALFDNREGNVKSKSPILRIYFYTKCDAHVLV